MRFQVRFRADGSEHQMELEAADESRLRQMVQGMGLTVVHVAPLPKRRMGMVLRKPRFDQSLFTQELIALLEAGLSLIETMETLRDKSGEGINRTVLAGIVDALCEGLPLSKALERQPDTFPALYVATVASAERTGHLAEALKRYHHYDARLAVVRKKVVASMVYPMVVIATGTMIILFLAFYVVPKFSQVYASMKDLPAAARLMLWWGETVRAHGAVLFAAIVIALVLAVLALRSTGTRAKLMTLIWALPRMDQYQRLFALTRFYRTLGLLLSGGMSVVASLELSSQLLPARMQPSLSQALGDISAGKALSTALPAAGLTTPVAERLIRVGEQSGEVAAMVTRSAEFCDDELDRAIDTLMRMVEPVLMLVVGAIVGTIVFLLYMPIFQLAGSVG